MFHSQSQSQPLFHLLQQAALNRSSLSFSRTRDYPPHWECPVSPRSPKQMHSQPTGLIWGILQSLTILESRSETCSGSAVTGTRALIHRLQYSTWYAVAAEPLP